MSIDFVKVTIVILSILGIISIVLSSVALDKSLNSSNLTGVVGANGFAETAPSKNITLSIVPVGLLSANNGAIESALDTDVTSKKLTGFESSSGVITDTDSILTGINKLAGNIAVNSTSILAANGFSASGPGQVLTLGITPIGLLKGNANAIESALDMDVTDSKLTGFASSNGVIDANDSILTGINKLNGNVANCLPLPGGTMSGIINMGSFGLTNVGSITTNNSNVIIGNNITNVGQNDGENVLIGSSVAASTGSTFSIVIGSNSTVSGLRSIAIGPLAAVNGSVTDCIMIGTGSNNVTNSFKISGTLFWPNDSKCDIGRNSDRFKDLYLSGTIFANNITSTGTISANKLITTTPSCFSGFAVGVWTIPFAGIGKLIDTATLTELLDPSNEFVPTASTGRVEYTGTETRYFQVIISFGMLGAELNTQFRPYVSKNGAPNSITAPPIFQTVAGYTAFTISETYQLATNETVQLAGVYLGTSIDVQNVQVQIIPVM